MIANYKASNHTWNKFRAFSLLYLILWGNHFMHYPKSCHRSTLWRKNFWKILTLSEVLLDIVDGGGEDTFHWFLIGLHRKLCAIIHFAGNPIAGQWEVKGDLWPYDKRFDVRCHILAGKKLVWPLTFIWSVTPTLHIHQCLFSEVTLRSKVRGGIISKSKVILILTVKGIWPMLTFDLGQRS